MAVEFCDRGGCGRPGWRGQRGSGSVGLRGAAGQASGTCPQAGGVTRGGARRGRAGKLLLEKLRAAESQSRWVPRASRQRQEDQGEAGATRQGSALREAALESEVRPRRSLAAETGARPRADSLPAGCGVSGLPKAVLPERPGARLGRPPWPPAGPCQEARALPRYPRLRGYGNTLLGASAVSRIWIRDPADPRAATLGCSPSSSGARAPCPAPPSAVPRLRELPALRAEPAATGSSVCASLTLWAWS